MIKITLVNQQGLALANQAIKLRTVVGNVRETFTKITDAQGCFEMAPIDNSPDTIKQFRSSPYCEFADGDLEIKDGARLVVTKINADFDHGKRPTTGGLTLMPGLLALYQKNKKARQEERPPVDALTNGSTTLLATNTLLSDVSTPKKKISP